VRSVLVVLGTRPEAIKLAPVIEAARGFDDWRVRVCNTGQHRELLAPILDGLRIDPDVELHAMRPGHGLAALLHAVMRGLDAAVQALRPDAVIVQGDTTSVLAAALAAHRRGVPVCHVEAGLRTGDLSAPFPEEGNRVVVARLAGLHLAPTLRAADNLRAEGVPPARIAITGNTAVDAVRRVRSQLPGDGSPPSPMLRRFAGARPCVLVTGHRRESFGAGLEAVCDGLLALARRHPEVDLVVPVHLNPAVQRVFVPRLGGRPNIALLPPLRHAQLVWLMGRARFVITDSGGIQEEAPELGKPVLLTRAATERPEMVEHGGAVVVGHDANALLDWAHRWLSDDAALHDATPTTNPFGDGRAGPRCVSAIRATLGLRGPSVEPWIETLAPTPARVA
jgi:UDP-N-acetylglucosamine 2-epimerase (non-hydrolysing)